MEKVTWKTKAFKDLTVDEFFEIILKAKKKFEIKNNAVALLHIIDIVKAHLGDAP